MIKKNWKKIKTKFQEVFWNKRALSSVLCNKKLTGETIRKAQKWIKISSTTEFEIYASLVEKKYMNLWEYTITELFSLVDKN